jgi:UDP-glucose:(heptosyl)LPS alpha-1,3-glucosyltransferase
MMQVVNFQEKVINENHPLKIAIIRRSYRPDGGAEKIIQRILVGLKQHYPAQISLISESWQTPSDADTRDNHIVLSIKKHFCLFRSCRIHAFVKDVQATLVQHSFDLIQSHERMAGCQLYRAGDGVHAEWLAIRQHYSNPLKRKLLAYSPFQKAMCKAEADMFHHPALQQVICVSKRGKAEILKHYPNVDPNKLNVIYNGIDLQQYRPITQLEKQKLREKYGYDKQAPIALFVGSGFQRKGLEQILNALALQVNNSASSTQKWTLLVIGQDKNLSYFQKRCQQLEIASQVHFLGVQTAMQEWYGLADLLIHPAWYEPFGNIILEAMASGLGVICSENCGTAELMTSGQEGYIVQHHDDQQLADCLARCLVPQHLQKLGQSARKTAEQYPTSRMIKSFVAVYQKLLKNK